jgi:hypothetical protein
MAGIFDVVAYDFKGDRLCPECLIGSLPTHSGEALEAFAHDVEILDAETLLTKIAQTLGINRMIEKDFSTSQFPKVVFRGHVGHGEQCDGCKFDLND